MEALAERELRMDDVVLRNVTDLVLERFEVFVEVDPVDEDLAARGSSGPVQSLEQGRFPSTGRAEEGDEVPRVDLEVDVVENADVLLGTDHPHDVIGVDPGPVLRVEDLDGVPGETHQVGRQHDVRARRQGHGRHDPLPVDIGPVAGPHVADSPAAARTGFDATMVLGRVHRGDLDLAVVAATDRHGFSRLELVLQKQLRVALGGHDFVEHGRVAHDGLAGHRGLGCDGSMFDRGNEDGDLHPGPARPEHHDLAALQVSTLHADVVDESAVRALVVEDDELSFRENDLGVVPRNHEVAVGIEGDLAVRVTTQADDGALELLTRLIEVRLVLDDDHRAATSARGRLLRWLGRRLDLAGSGWRLVPARWRGFSRRRLRGRRCDAARRAFEELEFELRPAASQLDHHPVLKHGLLDGLAVYEGAIGARVLVNELVPLECDSPMTLRDHHVLEGVELYMTPLSPSDQSHRVLAFVTLPGPTSTEH